jgi:hypothetical protein
MDLNRIQIPLTCHWVDMIKNLALCKDVPGTEDKEIEQPVLDLGEV